ncbi:MAG TPA: hypothetical protein VE975_02115 [Actinomycetota bacterium]|jgi:hypothetical protein|nr:hypothetical protein [Actinomycetota bacterium]
MPLGDWIRGFFSKKRNPGLVELEAFIAEHRGVEGYIEPRTATNPTTLLVVDRSGDHLRAPVREPEDAVAFCDRHGVPVYNASVVGYPKRMRDFERSRRAPSSEVIDERIAELEERLKEPGPNHPNE